MIQIVRITLVLFICALLVSCSEKETILDDTLSRVEDEIILADEEESNDLENEEGNDDTTMIVGENNKGEVQEELTSEEGLTSEEEMLKRTIVSKGNNYRFRNVIDKLKKGENITVAFIGGSITEGYFAGTKDIFPKLVTEYLGDTYGNKDNITYVNAGLSGTPSMLGLIRSERDILVYNPDLVFIEFAVNDAQTMTDKTAYESLIRKILKQDNEPAVFLLFSVIKSGYTCQTPMSEIGFYYSLPMISVKNVINKEFDEGTMAWEDWSNDESHPNTFGHELYSKMIIYTMEQLMKEELSTSYVIPEDTKFNKDWSDMKLYDSSNLVPESFGSFEKSSAHLAFSNSFSKSTSQTKNEGMKFIFNGNTLFLTYKTVSTGNYGTAEIYVDGEFVMHLNGLTKDGWNNPTTELIYSEKESEEHIVEIRMQAGDEEKQFDLLAIGMVK